jgi:Raf kinase inhibitor-like YbhB/YbcL family protein
MRTKLLLIAGIIATGIMSFSNKPELIITSTAFTKNGMIPIKYSCEGDDVNPPLHIAGVPSGTQSLALIMHDPDAPMKGGFTHWVMWNIDVDGNIPENYKGAEQGMNGMAHKGYKGMCPPSGVHHYHFKVYALDTKLKLDQNTDKGKLENAMGGHILAEGDLVGLYRKIKEGEVK